MAKMNHIVYVIEPNPHYEGALRSYQPPIEDIAMGVALGITISEAAKAFRSLNARFMRFNDRIYWLLSNELGEVECQDTGYRIRVLD